MHTTAPSKAARTAHRSPGVSFGTSELAATGTVGSPGNGASWHPQLSWSVVPIAVAVVLALSAFVVQPNPLAVGPLGGDGGAPWPWVLGSLAFFVVDRFMTQQKSKGDSVIGGPGWLVLLAMVAAHGPSGALTAAVVTAGLVVLVDAVGRRAPGHAAARFVAFVLPAGILVAAMSTIGTDPVGVALGGLLAGGCTLLLTRAVLPTLDPSGCIAPPSPRPLVIDIIEWMGLGAAAALLGSLVMVSGWVAAPVFLTGIAVVAVADWSRRQADALVDETVESLLTALEAKDLYTRGHAERVGEIAGAVGREMGLEGVALHRLVVAARLHDIGKVVTPRELLRKPGRLTDLEYCQVQRHATVVADLLADIPGLQPMVPIIMEHHHHVDGSGYETGSAVVIPSRSARILAAADAFDAMTTHRPYRRALSTSYAFAELRRCAGTQFDPAVVSALIRVIERTGGVTPAVGAESDEVARRHAEQGVSSAR